MNGSNTNAHQYPAVERRSSESGALLILVQQVHSEVKVLNERLTEHMSSDTNVLAEAVSDILTRSFPAGDPDGHRKAHEAQMQAIEDRAKFWKSMLFEVSKYGLFGVIGWLAWTVWTAFLLGPKK